MRKGVRWAAAAGVVLLVGVLALAGGAGGEDEETQYISAAVSRVDLNSIVTATGTLQPLVRVDVGSQLSGQIAELYVDFNDTVARDQPMARLDPVPYEARVREADAALKSAHTSADIRRAMIGRAKSSLASVRARRAVLEARLSASQAAHDQAQ
jgi:HlyD family secretion protein